MDKTKSPMNVDAQEKFGGSAGSSNEEPVSSVGARRPPDSAIVKDGAPPVSGTKASGRDHPIETEHDHAHQKLHGESERRLKDAAQEG